MQRRSFLAFLGAVAAAPLAVIETVQGRGLIQLTSVQRYISYGRAFGFDQSLNEASLEQLLIEIKQNVGPLHFKPTHIVVEDRVYASLLNTVMHESRPVLEKQLADAITYGDGVALLSCEHPDTRPWWRKLIARNYDEA